MGNANIDPELKKEIELILKETSNRVRYQNLKGFIDNACLQELNNLRKKKEK